MYQKLNVKSSKEKNKQYINVEKYQRCQKAENLKK